ncbi:MAG: two-component system sensor histidine kinase NtrB [bacterium]
MHIVENFQKILDNLQDIIMVVDSEYRIVFANHKFAAMVNMGIDEVVGKFCYELSQNRTASCINNCPLNTVFKDGSEKTISHSHTFWDGVERYEEITFTPIKDKDNQVVQVLEIIKDLTENKKIERQLIHSEKLACMGEIAASLCHEISNPLGIITGFVQRILDKVGSGHAVFEELKIVEQECLRCNRIIRDLLNFVRPGCLQKSICNIADVVHSVIQLFDYKLKEHNIQVVEDMGDETIYVKVDIYQFQQVLVNIVLNAVHAMPRGGRLHIRLSVKGRALRRMIELIIQDEGSGIHPSNLNRIFDPFFSTKADEGTGLGLSLSRRIIEAHGGTIHAQSEIGKGTSMIIHLPLTGVEKPKQEE